MNPNLDKGNELERAVGIIESFILQKNPNLKNNPFIIENKKTVIIDEVRHEIDWYIEIDLGNGYKSIFLFECKNWIEPIGKNEIIVFSEIINATKAAKGYFVAKEFGRYAVAQAKKDTRIELLTVTDKLVELVDFPHFHYIFADLQDVNIIFDYDEGKPPTDLQIESVYVNGLKVDANLFAVEFGKIAMNHRLDQEPTATMDDGDYLYEAVNTIRFDSFDLSVNGEPRKSAFVKIKFLLRVKKPRIILKFDVEKRGRVIEYENFNLPNNQQISARFILLDEDKTPLVI